MSEPIYHGWTQSARKPNPATKSQMLQLAALVMSYPESKPRTDALAALDNAIECLEKLGAYQEWIADAEADGEPTYDEIIRDPKLLTPELRAKNTAWWNEYYSDENVQKRLEVTG